MKNEFYPLQKAYTTPHFVVLQVRVPGKSFHIYIGRGNQYLGIYPYEKAPPAFLRIQDRFLDYIRSHLVGAKLSKIELISENGHELYQIQYKTDNAENYFYVGYKDRQMFFARREKDLIFCSWHNQIENFQNLVWPDSSFSKLNTSINIESYLKLEEGKSVGAFEQKKREKFLLKKIENIKSDLKVNDQWKEIEEKLLENQIDLSGAEVKISGQKFNLVGLRTEWEKKDFIFKKIKKLKRGKSILEERLSETLDEYDKTSKGQFVKQTTKEKAIPIIWSVGNKKNNQTNVQAKDFMEIKMGQIVGLVGLNSSGNDHIRSISNKEHFWLHIENYPGAHLIIKTDSLNQLTNDHWAAMASILRDYSKLDILEIPLMYTQVKNLKGIKGVRGEVIANKVKYLKCPYRDWKEIISIV